MSDEYERGQMDMRKRAADAATNLSAQYAVMRERAHVWGNVMAALEFERMEAGAAYAAAAIRGLPTIKDAGDRHEINTTILAAAAKLLETPHD